MNLSRLAGASNSTKGQLAIGSWCSIKELCFQVVSIPNIVSYLTRAMKFHYTVYF